MQVPAISLLGLKLSGKSYTAFLIFTDPSFVSTDPSELASKFYCMKQPRAFLGGVVVYHKVGFSIPHIRQTPQCIHRIVFLIQKSSVLVGLDVVRFVATLVCLVDVTTSWELCKI